MFHPHPARTHTHKKREALHSGGWGGREGGAGACNIKSQPLYTCSNR